jgi:hypothetical protein
MPDVAISFLVVLVLGAAVGVLYDRFAGPGWLARQFAGTRGTATSALVGVAGAAIGLFVALLLGLVGLIWLVLLGLIGAVAVVLGWRAIS